MALALAAPQFRPIITITELKILQSLVARSPQPEVKGLLVLAAVIHFHTVIPKKDVKNITITGGELTVTGGTDAAGIGGGYNSEGDVTGIHISGTKIRPLPEARLRLPSAAVRLRMFMPVTAISQELSAILKFRMQI